MVKDIMRKGNPDNKLVNERLIDHLYDDSLLFDIYVKITPNPRLIIPCLILKRDKFVKMLRVNP